MFLENPPETVMVVSGCIKLVLIIGNCLGRDIGSQNPRVDSLQAEITNPHHYREVDLGAIHSQLE